MKRYHVPKKTTIFLFLVVRATAAVVAAAFAFTMNFQWLRICCGIFAPTCELSAGNIFHPMPDFDDGGDYVTFQEGTLKWIADRMEVNKQIEKLE